MKTTDAAIGKWHGILSALGMDENFLRDRHGACPLCGGKDRFRFDDKEGKGTFYCNACGAGDGMDLAIKFTGMDFKDLAAKIDGMIGNIQAKPVKPLPDPSRRIRQVLSMSRPLDKADAGALYLRNRGLPFCKALLFCERLRYYDENGDCLGEFPAIVSRAYDATGAIITLHMTYLSIHGEKAPVPSPKKILPPIKRQTPTTIRLTKPYAHIGIAEGIETALAVMAEYKIPCWAAMTAGNMEKFIPPEGVEKVTAFGDNDKNYRGHAAAYKMAYRMQTLPNPIQSDVIIPDHLGDFADSDNRG